MKIRSFSLLLAILCIVCFGEVAQAGWNHGIGTGIFRLNLEGDIGMDINAGGIGGTIFKEIDFDPEDVSDLMETAFGLGGYSTDGKWMIQYSIGTLVLEGKPSKTIAGIGVITTQTEWESTGGEFTVGYPLVKSDSFTIRAYGGLRYTNHDVNIQVALNGVSLLQKEIDETWADVLIGLSADIPFARDWSWNNKFDAGFGGSEGTYQVYSGISWRFAQHWSTSLYGKYTAVEYENSNMGAADWYLYDVDEFGFGLGIVYNW
jgi:hypothetical protein